MRLLLIRHGQTPANVRGELATARPGPGLTQLGRRQAAAILACGGRRQQIAAIYVSPAHANRADRGAAGAASLGLEPRVLEGLEEIEAGDLEDRRDMPSVMTYVRTAFGWAAGDLDVRMPGAIDGTEFFGRFDAGGRADRGAASGCDGRDRLARCRDPGLDCGSRREPQRGRHGAPPPRQHRRRGADRVVRGWLARARPGRVSRSRARERLVGGRGNVRCARRSDSVAPRATKPERS